MTNMIPKTERDKLCESCHGTGWQQIWTISGYRYEGSDCTANDDDDYGAIHKLLDHADEMDRLLAERDAKIAELRGVLAYIAGPLNESEPQNYFAAQHAAKSLGGWEVVKNILASMED